MPRQPKLRKKRTGKTTYWFTKAGGDTYFGSVEGVSYRDARNLFNEHIKSLSERQEDSKRNGPTASDLVELFLAWIEKNRSEKTYESRSTHCNRFLNFRVGSQKTRIADLPANRVKGADLEAWLEHLENSLDLGDQTRRHAETSIKHCWNWATKNPSPTPYLSPTYRPFSGVERVYVPPKVLTEDDLIADKEIEALFAAAAIDLDSSTASDRRLRGPRIPMLGSLIC
jgi:hypothetical protein